MMGAIGRCHSCELPIIEGESYHIYGGNTSHSNNQCVQRLKAENSALQQRVAELEKDAERYRWLRLMRNRDDMDTDVLQFGTEAEFEAAIDACIPLADSEKP